MEHEKHLIAEEKYLNTSKTTDSERSHGLNKTGKVLIGLTGGIAVGLSVVCASFVSPAFRKFCLPFIPATDAQIKNVFEILKSHHCNGKKLIDLGSGDGRIVLEAARRGFQVAHGVELNFWLVLYSKLAACAQGLSARTQFRRQDLWTYNLSSYDTVVIFGVEQMMSRLEVKLEQELCKNSVIVACRFPLAEKVPLKTLGSGVDTVWLYKM